jgi:hypothetical protein
MSSGETLRLETMLNTFVELLINKREISTEKCLIIFQKNLKI